MNLDENSPLQAMADISKVFKILDIQYFIGGSFASSVHGEFRATNDIDIVCDISPSQTIALNSELEEKFIVDDLLVKKSLRSKNTFNIIHDRSFVKIDIFLVKNAFHREEMKRAQSFVLPGLDVEIFIATTEDILLSKLNWYKIGGEQSDRQWRDILGVIKIQGLKLDRGYLNRWAEYLEVEDLLAKLIK